MHCSPFDIFGQDMDEVIMLINFYIELGNENPPAPAPATATVKKERRIRVNDKTATGGWF